MEKQLQDLLKIGPVMIKDEKDSLYIEVVPFVRGFYEGREIIRTINLKDAVSLLHLKMKKIGRL